MRPEALYELLDWAGIEYEVVESFEGVRVVRFEVEEKEEEK